MKAAEFDDKSDAGEDVTADLDVSAARRPLQEVPERARFALRLISQKWLRDDFSQRDLCSHGKLRLEIGGQVLADGSEDLGISETALALLRTLERDHTTSSPVAERLVFHGCGTMLMMGCPIGVNWSVRHDGSAIQLDDVAVYPTTNERDVIALPDVAITLTLAEYRAQVLPFAEAARTFFLAAEPKTFDDDFGHERHVDFWGEFDDILDRHLNTAGQ